MEQGANPGEQVENPVLAGFRSVIMLIGALQEKGDPRAEPAKQAMQQLLSALSGGDLPMQPPLPAQPGQQPGGMPPGPGMGAPGAEPPMPEMVGNPFEAPPEPARPQPRPMGQTQNQRPGTRQPTVLT